jgi:hypothetical protein
MALGSLARTAAAAIAVGACSLGLLLVALPGPQQGDRLAVAVVHRLLGTRIGGAVLHLNGSVLYARCRPLHHGTAVVAISNGDRLRIRRTRFVAVPARHVSRSLQQLLPVSAATQARRAAEVDLAGPHVLYLAELVGRLMRGDRVIRGTGTLAGRPVYRVQLGNAKPRVELLVDRRTLKAVGVSFSSAHIHGLSRLVTGAVGC